MLKYSIFLMFFVVLACTANVHAVVLAHEPFDYSDGSMLNGQNGGIGWGAPWARENAFISGGSLVPPAGYGHATTGGRINTVAGAGRTWGRDLGFSIEMDPAVSTTYWLSVLYQRDDTNGCCGEWANIMQLRPSSGADSTSFGHPGSDEDLKVRLNSVNGPASGVSVGFSTTYLLLAKLVANPSGTPDEGYVSIFESGVDTVVNPAVWDASHTADYGQVLEEFSSNFGANVGGLQLDEIRIGTSYADVVPEPATLSLLGLGALAAIRRRKR